MAKRSSLFPKAILKQFKNDLPDLLSYHKYRQWFSGIRKYAKPTAMNNRRLRREKILKPRGLHSVGAVIGGLGLGLLARQWLPSASSTLIIGSIVTTAGVLLMLFR